MFTYHPFYKPSFFLWTAVGVSLLCFLPLLKISTLISVTYCLSFTGADSKSLKLSLSGCLFSAVIPFLDLLLDLPEYIRSCKNTDYSPLPPDSIKRMKADERLVLIRYESNEKYLFHYCLSQHLVYSYHTSSVFYL